MSKAEGLEPLRSESHLSWIWESGSFRPPGSVDFGCSSWIYCLLIVLNICLNMPYTFALYFPCYVYSRKWKGSIQILIHSTILLPTLFLTNGLVIFLLTSHITANHMGHSSQQNIFVQHFFNIFFYFVICIPENEHWSATVAPWW